MSIQGFRTDENFISTQRPQNWRQVMLLLYPNSSEIAKAPLTALTSLMKSESTDDPVYHWFQKILDARRLKINANVAAADNTITVDATFTNTAQSNASVATILKAGDMLYIEQTNEVVRVSADPTSTTVVPVTRAQGGTAATAITILNAGVNPYMFVIGSSYEEGSMAPTSMAYDPVEINNYCQIFRSTLSITRTAMRTRLRTGDAVTEAKRECLEYFTVDMERAFWFNPEKALITLNGNPARLTTGIVQQIKDQASGQIISVPGSGQMDMNFLEKQLEVCFRYGSSEKMVFGSNLVLLAFEQAIRKNTYYKIESGVKEYGMRVSRFSTPFGELVFKVHPLFNQQQGGTANGGQFNSIANNAYILDMSNIRYRYVDDVKYEKDLTPVGLDGLKSGYIGECGLELHHGLSHMVWTGITGGATDSN